MGSLGRFTKLERYKQGTSYKEEGDDLIIKKGGKEEGKMQDGKMTRWVWVGRYGG